jgi:hypothetical protein
MAGVSASSPGGRAHAPATRSCWPPPRFLARQNELPAAFLREWQQRPSSGEASRRDFVGALLELATRQYDVHVDLIRAYV